MAAYKELLPWRFRGGSEGDGGTDTTARFPPVNFCFQEKPSGSPYFFQKSFKIFAQLNVFVYLCANFKNE